MTLIYAFQAKKGVALVATDLLARKIDELSRVGEEGWESRTTHVVHEKFRPTFCGNRVAFSGALSHEEMELLLSLTTADFLSAPISDTFGIRSGTAVQKTLITYADVQSGSIFAGSADKRLTSLVPPMYASAASTLQDMALLEITQRHARSYGPERLCELSDAIEAYFLSDQTTSVSHRGFASYILVDRGVTELRRNLRGLEGLEEWWGASLRSEPAKV